MTVKEALTLKQADIVYLTRDDRAWRVAHVHPMSSRDAEIVIRQGKDELRLRGAAALRSLKRARETR